jgi:hypothetical protein
MKSPSTKLVLRRLSESVISVTVLTIDQRLFFTGFATNSSPNRPACPSLVMGAEPGVKRFRSDGCSFSHLATVCWLTGWLAALTKA